MASQLELDRRRILGGLAAGLGSVAVAGSSGRLLAQATGCVATPTETRGPFPADGTNGRPRISVLGTEGVIRRDLRESFAGMSGRADGVPLALELRLAQPGACAPRAGGAVYLWQNDAEGSYSLYDRADANYLRGLQPADAQGRVRFTLIVPGCYGGRYPHCHFEVFESLAAATSGGAPLLVSQLAFPADACRRIYQSDGRYGASLQNLARQPMERDFVFADADAAGRARQTIILAGDSGGYRGTATIWV
jgi:protocatechuate 3,4-dioxygenase beta subunit